MRPILILAAAALAGGALLPAAPASAQNGSFRASCRNAANLGNGYISAECADSTGRYRSSTLNAGACVGDIGNQNGMLACNGAVASGGAYVPDDRDRNRDQNRSDGDYRRGGTIAGSYRETCRDAEIVGGGFLTALCRTADRRWRESSIRYTACRSDISNQNGMLACEGALATGGRWIDDDDRW